MAFIDLGTRQMVVGQSPVVFDPLPFISTDAYLIFYEFTIANPNNVFSDIFLKAQINISGLPNFFAATGVELDIRPGRFSFFYPFSSLYQNNGVARFFAERRSKYRGGAESDSAVDLRLAYNDSFSTTSWRA